VLTAYGYLSVFDMLTIGAIFVTIWVRKQTPTQSYSYGYERFEVLAVFTSTMLAQLFALFIIKESVEHGLQQHEVHTGRFLLGTGIALFSHLLVIYSVKNDAFSHVVIASGSSWLQEHVADVSHSLCRVIPGLSVILLPRVNPFSLLAVSGAIICVVTGFLLEYEECHVCDAVAAVILAIMVIGTMLPMSIYTGKILLQTSPSHVLSQLDKCIREASTLDGVLEITNEHFWQLSFGQLAGSVTVRVRRDADEQRVLAHVTDKMANVVGKLTIQVTKDADWHTVAGATTQSMIYNETSSGHHHSHSHNGHHHDDHHDHDHEHGSHVH